MLTPPFRPALLPSAAVWAGEADVAQVPVDDLCGAEPAPEPAAQPGARARIGEIDPHLLCSILGTCLSTAELRKLMAGHIDVQGRNDLDVHHEGVAGASASGAVARALNKALDRRHAAALQRFARARDEAALAALWDDALRSGEIPGAYWALMTHRRATPALRQRAFGDVHMLSHLVGASNRADIRRLVALERDNAELKERLESQQARHAELLAERERGAAERERQAQQIAQLELRPPPTPQQEGASATIAALNAAVALQAERRERAETALGAAAADNDRLRLARTHALQRADELARELAAAEGQLRAALGNDGDAGAAESALRRVLGGRRLLYVGGRPSSATAIGNLVRRHGGAYQRHDGGIEDRKGLLAPALAWAELVVFPVDCIDHDSAQALKRACLRQGRRFVPLRSAGVASFVAGLVDGGPGEPPHNGLCTRHA